jgi:hypothetical protein
MNTVYVPATESFFVSTYGEDKYLEYLRQIRNHYDEKGWLENSVALPIFEPETKNGYLKAESLYPKIKIKAPGLARALGEQATPDKDEYPSLFGDVDVWLAGGEKYYADYVAMQNRRKVGDEIGFYTPGRYSGVKGYSDLVVPTHSIDRQFNDLVFAGLEAYRNHDDYHLIWNTTYWTDDSPWESTQTWKQGRQADGTTLAGNGSGYLYYPATVVDKYMKGQKPQSAKFVPSLRLIALESGLNLYEVAKIADFSPKQVPAFQDLSANSAEGEYQQMLNKLYAHFDIQSQKPELPKYESSWLDRLKAAIGR